MEKEKEACQGDRERIGRDVRRRCLWKFLTSEQPLLYERDTRLAAKRLTSLQRFCGLRHNMAGKLQTGGNRVAFHQN
jgi:hypothetical protein